MKRHFFIGAAVMVAFASFGLLQIKNHVKYLTKDIIEAKRQLSLEQQKLHVLEAEWAYLNEPGRLHMLAEHYLNVAVVPAERIHYGEELTVSPFRKNHHMVVTPMFKPDLSSYRGF